MIEVAIYIAIGFVIGWLVFKRPEKITELFAWAKSKIKGTKDGNQMDVS